MVAEMVEKPLTEAQKLVDRLEANFAMTPAEIARLTRLKVEAIQDIKRRKTTGNLQVRFLRKLMTALETSGNVVENAGIPIPDFSTPDFSSVPSADDPARFEVNADDPTPAPAKSLKDKAGDILGSILGGTTGADAPKRTKADDSEQAGLVAQLVPLGALLLVTSSTLMIRDPYKPCAPTMPEASAIAYPIIKRAVRELDARKKLSEGTEDAIIILLAVTVYGQRAIGTYKQIHAMEVERDRSNGQPNTGAAGVAGFAAHPFAADPARDSGARSGASVDVTTHAHGNGSQSGRAAHGPGGSADERRANGLLDTLLAADADGRKRLGIG